jgi:DNA-binding PadR family transcriptional regulator
MFGPFGHVKEMIYPEIEKFRQHGALSAETAMTVDDLGLSSDFKTFLCASPRVFGIFVEVGDKYYLSEESLQRFEKQLSRRPLRQWLKHTASVPKGLLRFYVFKLLSEKPMSGSEIMEEVEKQTGGRWKPSPGSVYPLLGRLRRSGYAEELPREESGVKRYVLTEKGKRFFEEHSGFEDKLQQKMLPMGPLFFLRMGLDADGLSELREPVKRFVDALFGLRLALKDNMSPERVAEVGQLLNDVSEKMESLGEKFRS